MVLLCDPRTRTRVAPSLSGTLHRQRRLFTHSCYATLSCELRAVDAERRDSNALCARWTRRERVLGEEAMYALQASADRIASDGRALRQALNGAEGWCSRTRVGLKVAGCTWDAERAFRPVLVWCEV
jgi:hypothetical protein